MKLLSWDLILLWRCRITWLNESCIKLSESIYRYLVQCTKINRLPIILSSKHVISKTYTYHKYQHHSTHLAAINKQTITYMDWHPRPNTRLSFVCCSPRKISAITIIAYVFVECIGYLDLLCSCGAAREVQVT